MKRAALALITTTCLAGCLGGSSVPPRTYYVLQDQAPASDAAATPSSRQSLVVAASAADVFYDAESLVFSRSPGQRAYYQFAAWTDRPARSVVQLAERRLQARGSFASVTSMSAGVRADLVLNTRLTISATHLYRMLTISSRSCCTLRASNGDT